ncbi:MAG: hypothetical protein FWH19_06120, partial [Treponema sp.]|nr:hypothetical protein [Treponema sp.]
GGRGVLVSEAGPPLPQGKIKTGAGTVAARRFGAAEIIDPRPFATGKLAETYKTYPNIGTLLPAMGYGDQQVKDLAATIDKADCDSVIIATPIDLGRIIKIGKPHTRVEYALQEIGHPDMVDVLEAFIKKIKEKL